MSETTSELTNDGSVSESNLIAMVSHDLKNPLTAIRMNADLMLQRASGPVPDEFICRLAENIRQNTDRMTKLISDLLDRVRIKAGRMTLDLKAESAAALIKQSLVLFRVLGELKRIDIVENGINETTFAYCDRERVMQVLSNLIGNAIKFTPEGGRIEISAKKLDSAVLFSVRDTGKGIPKEDIAHVFDEFWQGGRQGRQGSGLGLSISRGIVLSHGGKIWVESVLGQGSQFFFTVPRWTPDGGMTVAGLS